MKRYTLPIAMLGFSLITVGDALAGDVTPCERTAGQMQKACRHDVLDNFKVTQANCTNISEANDRDACREEAVAVREDELEECAEQSEERLNACDVLGEFRYDPDPLLDQSITFVDPDDVEKDDANPYVSIVPGHTYVLQAGEDGEEIVVVHVTAQTKEIQDVLCRVVVDVVMVAEEDEEDGGVEYVSVEHTDDWFAQDTDGNVYYCGELARNFEDGQLVDLDGSFEAGKEFAKAGLLIMANPELGLAHRTEFALGEAEDIIQYVELAAAPDEENENFPCEGGGAGRCLKTFDFAPLDPEATEHKYYLPGVGFVLAEDLDENGMPNGEREELVCVGDSLKILKRDACGIEDPKELLETLCELAPEAFCDDDDDRHGHGRSKKS